MLRELRVHGLLDHATDGRAPTEALVPSIRKMSNSRQLVLKDLRQRSAPLDQVLDQRENNSMELVAFRGIKRKQISSGANAR
ncbi:hypothetical protein [Bradyrhizobium elkanii]|uniref:hypothetical protein n=1 Tax=Bradyrhizobium elkanii TaxID=29448 RepID=UPI0020A10774|nr:hypothetical protein [Bradyrhizobium elkanii]MCP1968462.1 hypothetical protein [Bradyrhizobium elkanii]MCS4110038.1 hypothetical protein [Bradyrhizobium elkanii]